MARIDIDSIGRPKGDHHNLRLRRIAAIAAALAGGAAFVLAALVVFGAISPGESAGLWAAIALLAALWVTGLWWRWDAPDSRSSTGERERRGF
jgi:hypothetical protein